MKKYSKPKTQLKEKKSIEETKSIEEIKYVGKGDIYMPECLKKILDYFSNSGNKNYQVCLAGEKESHDKDLKKRGYTGKKFIHFDNNNLNENYPFLPISIKNAIKRVNKLVSNPENTFNKSYANLGIHTVGLVSVEEIQNLKSLGYGLRSWNSIDVYSGWE